MKVFSLENFPLYGICMSELGAREEGGRSLREESNRERKREGERQRKRGEREREKERLILVTFCRSVSGC